ncbi:MAG: T9SS type A sorting domain-containing protein [Saprospiraceae bacterium]|nr:T9SS type A sorting domain-containing protein [Saprospiraceae bacterium]
MTRQRFQQGTSWWDWRINKINHITSVPNGSVKVDDTTSVGRIFNGRLSYDKGSYLLHMLRWKLGDDAFFRGVRSYLHETQFNFAHTHQLQANLEQASGQNLDEYFKDWFTGHGYPSYQLNWNQNNSNQLYVQLNQTTSDASVAFFEMPVPVLFSGEGRDTLVRFDHLFSGESFTVPLDFKITSVKFDPDLWLLSANNTVNQVTSVHDQLPEELIHFQVSPNPSNENFVVTLELKKPEKVILSLINATGNIVTQQQLEFNSDRKKIMLQKSSLTAGNYFVRLQSTDWQYTKQLILN